MTDERSDAGPDMEVESRPDRKKAIIAVSIAVVVAVVVFGVIFPQLVDWNEVFDVLRGVDKVDFALTLLLGALRWIPSGWIYSIVLPGLSVKNGTQAWVATTGVGSTVPGSDLILRVAMYRSWGFPLERTMSGMFLSGIVEMATKLTLATLAVLLWGLYRLDLNALAIAAIAAAVIRSRRGGRGSDPAFRAERPEVRGVRPTQRGLALPQAGTGGSRGARRARPRRAPGGARRAGSPLAAT